jgi:hypothetical protein
LLALGWRASRSCGAKYGIDRCWTAFDIQIAFQEIDSELLQLAGVRDDAEVFPDEKPGMREPFPRLVGERRLSDRKARAEATATKAGAHEVVQSDEKPV